MKSINTIYSNRTIRFSLIINNKINRGDGTYTEGPLVEKYVSKVGNASLIFNPSIYLLVDSTNRFDPSQPRKNAAVPGNAIYRFNSMLSKVYKDIMESKMYREDGRELYLDEKLASKASRRMSLFRNSVIVAPCVIYRGEDNPRLRGVTFIVEGEAIGELDHAELINIINQIEHLDLTTYSMLVGLSDQVNGVDEKLNLIIDMLHQGPRAPNKTASIDQPIGLDFTAVRKKGMF